MRVAKKFSAQTVSLPAPVGGWNARNSLAEMPITDSPNIVNFFPLTTEIALRKGYSRYATGFSGQVDSLMAYYGGNTNKFFAVSSGNIYDISTAGAIGAPVVSGLTNSRWNYTNISTAGGTFIMCANGADKPRLYNGTTWTAIDAASTPSITGVTTTLLRNTTLFKTRLFFIENNSLRAWYLPVNSVGGAASQIDVSAIATKGGFIVDHSTWTIDAGQGVDDYYTMVTSRGQVIIYQGTDPSSASTWALKGVWDLGTPVGNRCLYKMGGDVLYISQDGLVPLSGALQSSRVNPRVAITDKIQFAVSSAVSSYGSNFGWDLLYYAPENMLILNVPIGEGSGQEQYVMNTISMSWSKFTGWEANCWELYNDLPFFGGNGFVGKAWDTNSDNGSNINAVCIQAFSKFGSAGKLKRWTMAKPIFRANGTPSVGMSMNVDFDLNNSTQSLSFTPNNNGLWGTGLWDVATWGGDFNIIQNWQSFFGIGYYGAPQLNIASQGVDVRWVSTDIVYETGAVI